MKKKILNIFIIILLLFIFLFINIRNYVFAVSQNLEQNIFRLHIIANSNNIEDQNLKLKVRDNIIKYINNISKDFSSKQEIIDEVSNNISTIQKLVEETIKENNFNYSVSIEIGNFYFPTKYYGNISLPAGMYDAIKIKIGKAEGENWWCSLFPPLCFTNFSTGIIEDSDKETLENNLDTEDY